MGAQPIQRAIVSLRREAVDLAILAAAKVVQENVDTEANRRMVDSFLESVATAGDRA